MSAFGRHLRELEAMRLITRELVEINGSKLIQIKITRTALKGAA